MPSATRNPFEKGFLDFLKLLKEITCQSKTN